MKHLLIGFAQNLTLPLAMVFCYAGLLRLRARKEDWARIASGSFSHGLLFGGGAILCMLMPLPIAPGINVDNRIALVALAGPFGGTVAACVAMVLASGYRWWIGGIGAWAGIGSIVSAGILGIVFAYRVSVTNRSLSLVHCIVLGLGAVAVSLPWTWALPASVNAMEVFQAFAIPVLIMYPFATMVVGGFLLQVIRHHGLASELRLSEERFRSFFNHAPDAMIMTDQQTGRIVDANPRACEFLLRPRSVLLGMVQAQVHPDSDHQAVQAYVENGEGNLANGHAATPLTTHLLRSDHSVIPVELVINTMSLGGRTLIVGVFRDIRERERAARALMAAQAITNSIVQTADAAILGLDRQGRIVLMNPALEHLTGYQLDDVRGKPWLNMGILPDVSTSSSGALADEFQSVLAIGTPRAIEGALCAKDGSRPMISWRCSIISDPSADIRLIAVGIDVSEQRSMEDRVRHAEKMQAVGQLAGGLAHDFNNQLQIISGYASMLQEGGEVDHQSAVTQHILDGCERAAALTRKLLAFSRKASVRLDTLDMNEIIRSASVLIKPALGVGIWIDVQMLSEVLYVQGDASSIENALLNLAFNARDAMPQGGNISIRLQREVPDFALIRASGFDLADGPYCRIDVSDTGMGMAKELRERIFEPFFTTKTTGNGTGLGLAAVHGAVVEHGGAITVQSAPGNGSCFSLWLPLLATPDKLLQQPDIISTIRPLTDAANLQIIVVDDEDAIGELMSQALSRVQFQVQRFDGGEAAVRWFIDNGAAVALAIVDLHMPGMNGIQVVDALFFIKPDLRVIISTGHGPEVLPDHLRRHPGISLLSKPYPMSQMVNHVRQRLK